MQGVRAYMFTTARNSSAREYDNDEIIRYFNTEVGHTMCCCVPENRHVYGFRGYKTILIALSEFRPHNHKVYLEQFLLYKESCCNDVMWGEAHYLLSCKRVDDVLTDFARAIAQEIGKDSSAIHVRDAYNIADEAANDYDANFRHFGFGKIYYASKMRRYGELLEDMLQDVLVSEAVPMVD